MSTNMSGAAPAPTKESALALLEGLLPEQEQIVRTLDRPIFVAAGAGSGKTFTLTRRIVWALCPGSGEGGAPFLDSLDQALVITFTEKAAGEIKERVRKALREAGLADEALKVDSAWVSTIHHMCARILRAHALDLGLDPSFAMVADQAASAMRAQALEVALDEMDGDPGLDALFAEFGGGTGSGRDGVEGLVTSLLNRAGSATDGLDSLEFVDAEADVSGVMRAVLYSYQALCGNKVKDADELARCCQERDALERFFVLAPSRRTAAAAAEVLDAVKGPNGQKWRAKAVNDAYKETRAALDAARAEVALGRAVPLQGPLMVLARCVQAHYDAAKREAGVLDNDDLLQLTARAFRDHPAIAEEYAHRFRLVMVDEFQDTNAQQVSMVKGLSGEGACHLTTVGDAQQAIYGFRGADVSVFEDRGREVGEAGTVRLAYNFRSDDAILRFVKRTCGDTGIVPSFMDLKPRDNRESDFPAAACPRVVVELTRAFREGRSVVPAAERTRVAAEQLADRLATIHEEGVEPRQMAVLMRSLAQAPVYIDALRAVGLESVVVGGSTFASAAEVRVVEALLRTLASPQDTKSGLFAVLESDMFALDGNDLLMLATRPQDVLDAPAKRRINVGARPGAPDFGDVAPSERLVRAREVLGRAWERVGQLPVADVVLMCVRESGWLDRLERRGVAGRAVAANVLTAIRHIRALAEEGGLDAIRASEEFSRWLNVVKEGPASLSGEGLNAVSLMTAHASKGLEFDVVAVVGCAGSDRTPAAPRLLARRAGDRELLTLAPAGFKAPDLGEDAPADEADCVTPLDWRVLMEEQRRVDEACEDGRLLYVALTRAKECVILCLNATVKKGGGLSPAMTGRIAETLFGETPVAGEGHFAYGGRDAGLLRCVDVSPAEGEPYVDDGDSLRYTAESLEGTIRLKGEGGGTRAFRLYDVDAETHAELGLWRPREGVFSYSAAHRVLGREGGPATLDEVMALPQPASVSAEELARAGTYPKGEAPAATRAARPRPAPVLADEDEPADTDDADRATNLGSAFHELARLMVETGREPGEERVALVADAYAVTRADRRRLAEALTRWAGSQIRAQALGHACVRAEVPFFRAVSSPLGEDLEGAIDLLACDAPGRGEALLVDYKTGDHGATYAQIRERHEMQARFYASVLLAQGFTVVTCAFVCVELEDETGEPVVVRYTF